MTRAKVKAKRKTAPKAKGKAKTIKPKILSDSSMVRYAGYPTTIVWDKTGKGRKALKELLWGDWMVVTGDEVDGHLPVKSRGCTGFVDKDLAMSQRVLEIIFVDIGQGDGCLVVTPDDKHIVVDAGSGDNMYRFLRWRYGQFKKDFAFEAAIISHSDLDHYGGFARLFAEPKLHFRNVYTNGLMERDSEKATGTLGPVRKNGARAFIDALVTDTAGLRKFVSKASNVGKKKYPTMLKQALDNGKFDMFQMLSVNDGHLPGYGPDNKVTIEVLGPVTDTLDGKPALRWFGDVGKTKNGHSVVLKLRYGSISVLLGGDLNIPSETLLLEHHSGGALPKGEEDRMAVARKVRKTFQVDFAKSCHHGSADFSRTFLAAVNPLATIISSGDDEPYSHPRADTLGTIGKYSRGTRPLIFSTELARSAPERIKHPSALRKLVDELMKASAEAGTAAEKKKLEVKADKFKKQLDRSVATYGAINLRTDGKTVVVAQKLETTRDKKKEWDGYQFEPRNGTLTFVSKFEDNEDADE